MTTPISSVTPKTIPQHVCSWGGGGITVIAIFLHFFKKPDENATFLNRNLKWFLGGAGLSGLCYGGVNGTSSNNASILETQLPSPPRRSIPPLDPAALLESVKNGNNQKEERLNSAEKLILIDRIEELYKAISETDFGAGGADSENKEVLKKIKGMLFPTPHWIVRCLRCFGTPHC